MRTAPSRCSGATQQPLLHADQLVPGAILTGIAFSNAWEVLWRQDNDVHMRMLRHEPPALCAEHRLQTFPTGTLRKCSVCGFAIESIAALLPSLADTPKAVVLVPTGPLVVPDRFTVYLLSTGQEVRLHDMAAWSLEMPVIPLLHPVWSVPEELRFLLLPEEGQ